MPINPDAKRLRRNAATRMLTIHPRLVEWMARPTPARLADLNRTGAWPFLTWCSSKGACDPTSTCWWPRTPATSTRNGHHATAVLDLLRRATRGSVLSKALGKQGFYDQIDRPQPEA